MSDFVNRDSGAELQPALIGNQRRLKHGATPAS
jgi:hypothetical protein